MGQPKPRSYEWDAAVTPSVIEPETFGTENDQAPTQVWTPTAWVMQGEEVPPLALRQLDDDSLAMLAYTSQDTLAEGCGNGQPYLIILPDAVQALQHAVGADVVLWDPVLDPAIHQDGEHFMAQEEGT